MAEKEEKKVEKEGNIKKAWNRIKKPLAAGILAAGLLISPVKRVEGAAIDAVRAPPQDEFSSAYIKQRWNLGWTILLKGWDRSVPPEQRKAMYEASLKYFKKAYEKAKEKGPEHERITAYYLYTWQTYALAEFEPTLKNTENRMLQALEMIEERLKEAPDDLDFLDLKLMILYNLGEMYAGVALDSSSECAQLNIKYGMGGMTKKECKERAINYIKKYLEFYNEERIRKGKAYVTNEKSYVPTSEELEKVLIDNQNEKKERLENYLKQLNAE